MNGITIFILIIVGYAILVGGALLILREKFPTLIGSGCKGDCNQGRLPCNCHLKDIGLDK